MLISAFARGSQHNPNLYVSITPAVLNFEGAMAIDTWASLCESFPERFMLGTSVQGRGGDAYLAEWLTLMRFLAKVRL